MAPKPAPEGAVDPKSTKNMFFFLPGWYARPTIANAFGSNIAGPIPYRALQQSKKTGDLA